VFGLAPDFKSVAFVSTTNYATPGAGWQVVPLQGFVPPRFHTRVTVFGGIAYLFGGSTVPFNISVGQVFNDLWALDLNDVIATSFVPGQPAGGWVQAIANGTAGMPRARAGHVMVTYGHHIWIYVRGVGRGGARVWCVPAHEGESAWS